MHRARTVARFIFICGSIIACGFGAWGYFKLSQSQSDFRRLSQLVGELHIKDPSKTNVMRLPPDKSLPDVDRWRVYLPTSGRFSFFVIQLQSKEYKLFDCENYELPKREIGEIFTVGFGEIVTSDSRDRVYFAKASLGSRSGFGSISQPSRFAFDPNTDFEVIPDPLVTSIYDSNVSICLKAVYRNDTDGKPFLTSATFICPELGPPSHDELIPWALSPDGKSHDK